MSLYTKLKRKIKDIMLKSSDIVGHKCKEVENVSLEKTHKSKDESLYSNVSLINTQCALMDCNSEDEMQIDNNIKEELNSMDKEGLFYEEIEFMDEEFNCNQELDNEYKFEEDIEYDEVNFLEDLECSEQLKNNLSLDCNYNIEQIKVEEIEKAEELITFKEELDFTEEIDFLDNVSDIMENCNKSEYEDSYTNNNYKKKVDIVEDKLYSNHKMNIKVDTAISLFYLNLTCLEKFILIDRYLVDDIDVVIQLKMDIEKSVCVIEDLMYLEDIDFRCYLLQVQEVLNDKKYLCYYNIRDNKNRYETSIYLQNNIEYYLENIQGLLLELITLIEDNLNI